MPGPYREGLPPQPPGPPEGEQHFTASETVRDLVIGTADGLTVPFALAAGLSGAVAANPLIVTAGLAEIAAGCVAMGLGGYLAAQAVLRAPEVFRAAVAGAHGDALGRAVVAAGAVVTRDVEPYTMVAGVPARRTGTVIVDGASVRWEYDE